MVRKVTGVTAVLAGTRLGERRCVHWEDCPPGISHFAFQMQINTNRLAGQNEERILGSHVAPPEP